MRRRLLVLVVGSFALLLAALLVPLSAVYAEARAADLHETRLAAATRFATVASDLGVGDLDQALDADLERYAEVTGARTWVVGTDGEVLASSSTAGLPGSAAADVRTALAGTPTPRPDALWPWSQPELVVATPIGRDAQVLGAVVVVDSTAAARGAVLGLLVGLCVGGLAALALVGWLVATPLVRWIVRPLDELEAQARELGAGHPRARVPLAGPPEVRSLSATFNEMAASVEHSQQQQRDLVADVSHQLANPLTAVRLRLEGLVARDPSAAPVLEETERLSRSLESVIELSRAGSRDRTAADVDVAAAVRERCEMWQPLFGELLEVALPDRPAPAVLEEDLVGTVVDVLLDNAAKYAPGSRVEVGLDAVGQGWELAVRDHGTGVDPEEAAALGRRFHRLPRHADVDGTGLGLSIVVLRLRDAGGEVGFEAAEPGLRARVRFPAGRARGTTAGQPGGAAPAR